MTQSQRWLVLGAVLLAGLLVYLLRPILMPFLVGALLAYLGDPLVDRLERLRLRRTGAVLVVFAVLVAVVLGLVLLLMPMVGAQVDYVREQLPAMVGWIEATALPWLERELDIDLAGILRIEELGAAISDHWRQTGDIATTVLARVTRSGLALFGWLASLVLIPVVAFYLMRDWDGLVARVRDLLPRRIEPTASMLTRECDEVLGAFLRGQLLVMLSLGVIYALGLWLIGLDLALLIGMVAGIASIVPYLGTIVGLGGALVAGLFQFGELWPLVGIAAVFAAGQMVEGMVLTPMLVGDRIGMHPVAVIFAVLAGGQLFGFVGVLLALPVGAVVMVLLRHAHDRYKGSELYGQEGDEAEET